MDSEMCLATCYSILFYWSINLDTCSTKSVSPVLFQLENDVTQVKLCIVMKYDCSKISSKAITLFTLNSMCDNNNYWFGVHPCELLQDIRNDLQCTI